MNKTMNSIGWKYGLMGVIFAGLQFLIAGLLQWLLPEFTDKYSIYLTFALILFVDGICVLFLFLVTHSMPKAEIEKKRLGFGPFLLCVLIMYGLVFVGAIIGLFFHLPLTIPFSKGADNDELTKLMLNSNIFLRILVVGILAPIFEELMFRKILIDHLAVKGQLVAILASGLMFGLFHGNFHQAFFAAFIGCLFAYIYIKTGKIIYTIILHMFLNTATSAVTVGIVQWYMKAVEKVGYVDVPELNDYEMIQYLENNPGTTSDLLTLGLPTIVLFAWIGLLFILAVGGLITLLILVCLKKIRINRVEGDITYGKQVASIFASPCMYIFYVVCFLLFLETYLPDIIQSVIKWTRN